MELVVNQIYNMDCRDGLKKIECNSIDQILTDPPYGIRYGLNEGLNNRSKDGILPGYVDIPFSIYSEFSKEWIEDSFRVLKDTGTLYIVSGWQSYPILYRCVEEAGSEFFWIVDQ